MPVTAKLSKRFYDVLGEDIANELVDWFNAVDLTYRTELRDFNDLNFARFDAKLEQRLAEFDAKLEQRLAEFDARLQAGLAALRVEFRTELAAVRTDLIRWMFAFWVTNFIGIAGLLIALHGR